MTDSVRARDTSRGERCEMIGLDDWLSTYFCRTGRRWKNSILGPAQYIARLSAHVMVMGWKQEDLPLMGLALAESAARSTCDFTEQMTAIRHLLLAEAPLSSFQTGQARELCCAWCGG